MNISRYLPGVLQPTYDIFISYTRSEQEKAYARKLYEQLESLDYRCFLDRKEAPGGHPLESTIKSALRHSHVFVLVATDKSLRSGYVQKEFSLFAATGRPIIAINVASALSDEVLAQEPWKILKERDLVWLEETAEAHAKGIPSPEVYEGIQENFYYTRRRVVARRWATGLITVASVAAALAAWQGARVRRQTVALENKSKELQGTTDRLVSTNADLEQRKTQLLAETASARALYLASRGVREYETDPLTGLAFTVAALRSVPAEDKSTEASVQRSIQELMKAGRIARLDHGDFEKPYFFGDLPYFVVARPGKNGQLRDVETGQLIETLHGEVENAESALSEVNEDRGRETPTLYLLINFKNKTAELRRRNGSVVVSGDIAGVRYGRAEPYFVVDFREKPSEIRTVNDDRKAITLKGKVDDLTFVPGTPYFLATYKDSRSELRRVETGAIVMPQPALHDDRDMGIWRDGLTYSLVEDRITSSHDRSCYAIRHAFREATLYRTVSNQPVPLSGAVDNVIFSENSDFYAVSYQDKRGELRSTDSPNITLLSSKLDDARFDAKGRHVLVIYRDNTPSEVHDLILGTMVRLPSHVRKAELTPDSAYFYVEVDPTHHALVRVDGAGWQEFDNYFVDYGKDLQSGYYIAHGGLEHLVQQNTGDKLYRAKDAEQIFASDAGSKVIRFVYGSSLISMSCGSSCKHECLLMDAVTGKIESCSFPPSINGLNAQHSPKGHYFLLDDALDRIELRELSSGTLIRAFNAQVGSRAFSPDDRYLVLRFGGGTPGEIVEAKTGKSLAELPTEYVSRLTFSADSRLLMTTYYDPEYFNTKYLQRTAGYEIRRVPRGELLDRVLEAEFSPSGQYFEKTLSNNRSEMWSDKGEPHLLTELGVGMNGLWFDDARQHAIIWYNDRAAYLIDLDWLESIHVKQGTPTSEELIQLACGALKKAPSYEQILKSVSQQTQMQVCR